MKRELTCINTGNTKSISIDTKYELIEETENRFIIINDKGIQSKYSKKLFKEERVERAAPRQRRAVQPAPEPVIPVISEITINTSAVISDSTLSFNGNVVFGNHTYTLPQQNIFQIFGTSISCGIYQLSGVTTMISSFTNLKEGLERFINDNRNNFILSQDITVDTIIKDLINLFLQDTVACFQGEDANTKSGILLLSCNTNVNQTTVSDIVFEELDNISQFSHNVLNPNSRNPIRLWSVQVEE